MLNPTLPRAILGQLHRLVRLRLLSSDLSPVVALANPKGLSALLWFQGGVRVWARKVCAFIWPLQMPSATRLNVFVLCFFM